MRLTIPIDRRALVRGLLLGGPISMASSGALGQATLGSAGSGVLLDFFSRAGENYYHRDRIALEVGNTKVVAGMISDRTGCDVYEILAADPYPEDYEETRERNVQEQDADARPEIASPLPSINGYDTIIIGSPIWSSRPPMIMSTFAESFAFTGKTVLPVVTFAVSGMGGTECIYQDACRGATFGEGLAIQGEDVTDAPDDVTIAVETWLRDTGLLGTSTPG